MEAIHATEGQFRSTTTPKYANLLYNAKCFSFLDLFFKMLFVFCFPMPEAFFPALLLCIPTCIALYGICIEKEPINKAKWLLPAMIHHAILYVFLLTIFFGIQFVHFLIGQSQGIYIRQLPLEPVRQNLVLLLLSGVGIGVAVFFLVQMVRLFFYKWPKLVSVRKGCEGKLTEDGKK